MKYLFDQEIEPIFVSSGYFDGQLFGVSDNGVPVDFESLPRLLRVMLTCDGTLSKAIESAFFEPITIDLLEQVDVESDGREAKLIRRDINLIGMHSKARYTFARSYLDLSVIPENLASELEETGKGVGWLLRKLNQEQFREVFTIGWSKDLPVEEHPKGIDLGVYRVYCIKCNGRRFMEITEHYPIDLYR